MVVASSTSSSALKSAGLDDEGLVTEGLATGDPTPMGADPDLRDRILDGALTLVGRWGVAKTSLADVARTARCSRATLYRAFPGGKQHLFLALAEREIDAYLEAVTEAIATADDLPDAVTRGLVVATRLLRDHDAAQFVLAFEPDLVVPYLSFHRIDVVYRTTSATVGPHLERYLPADRAAWLAEWAARIFITYLFNPDPAIDLADAEQARHHIETFVLPTFTGAAPAAAREAVVATV